MRCTIVLEFDNGEGARRQTIAVQGATTQETLLHDLYKDSTIKNYKSVDDAIMNLAAGRVDVVFSD